MVSQIKVNEIIKQSGSSISIGESGTTINIPSGATITNNGSATGFLAPYFHATSSSTSIANNTAVTVINGSESWDTDNLYDTSTGRFTVTASTTGYYYFYAGIGFDVITANRIQIGLRYNNGDSDAELLTNETQSD